MILQTVKIISGQPLPCQAYSVVWSKHSKYQLLNEKHGLHCITILFVQEHTSYKIFFMTTNF